MERGNKRKLVVAASCIGLLIVAMNLATAGEIHFWMHWGPQQAAAVTDAIIPSFRADTGIDVNLTFARPMEEKLTLATAAGAAPDVVVVKANNLAALVEAGLLQPIERYVASGTKIRKDNYDSATWNLGHWKGRMYAVPAIEVGPIGGLIFHRGLFALTGLEARTPSSIPDLMQYHRKLTKIDSSGQLVTMGFHPMMAGAASVWPILYDIDWYDPKTDRINLTSQAVLDMVEDMRFFLEYARLDVPGVNRFPLGDWTGGFSSGKTGMMSAGYYTVGELSFLLDVDEADFGYGWMPSPLGDKWILPRGWLLAIPQGAKNPEIGLRFIERFVDGEGAKAFWDTQGWLNGNLRFMRTLPLPRHSGIWFFIDSLTQADRLGAWPQFPKFEQVMGQWGSALWNVFTRQSTPMEAFSNIERQFNR